MFRVPERRRERHIGAAAIPVQILTGDDPEWIPVLEGGNDANLPVSHNCACKMIPKKLGRNLIHKRGGEALWNIESCESALAVDVVGINYWRLKTVTPHSGSVL